MAASNPLPTAGNRHERRVATACERRRERATPLPNALGYTVDDACRMGGFGRTTAYALRNEGKLTFIKVAGRTIVVGDSLRALLGVDA
jgi:hypothetical protein